MYKLIGTDGKEYGPVTGEVLRQWIAEGRANGSTRVLPENTTEWKTLRDLPEFAGALGAQALPSTPAPFSAVPQPRKNNPLALAGLILGIISVTIGLCCCGVLFSIAGIICSSMALSQIGRNPQQEGRGMALVGLVLSILGLVAGVGIMIFYGLTQSIPELMRKIQRL